MKRDNSYSIVFRVLLLYGLQLTKLLQRENQLQDALAAGP